MERKYIDVIGDISYILDNPFRGKRDKPLLYPLLKELKKSFGIEISKEFLKDLITSTSNKHKKTLKVNNLLRKEGLLLKQTYILKKEYRGSYKEVDIVDFSYNKNKINVEVKPNKEILEKNVKVDNTKMEKTPYKFNFIEI